MPNPQIEAVAREICQERGYRFEHQAGEGTFKETFRVTPHSGASLALKVFKPGYSSPERESREIDAMTRCSHPNVGTLIYIGPFASTHGRHLYMLEEFFSGGALSQRIAHGLLPLAELQELGTVLIQAVSHIASHDLVHRDLKPDNIMFREDGTTPVVVDFGIVRDLGNKSLTPTHFAQGPCSPYYAAPEQLLNAKEMIDWRTDQFSLGVLLTIASAGYHPYAELDDSQNYTVDRVWGRAGPSDRFRSWTEQMGLAALERMVAPWPIERFRTPDALARAWDAQRGAAE